MAMPLRIGILGCAKVAGYALIAPARLNPDVVLSGVASRDIGRAREFARQQGIARVYASYEELIADPCIDVVYNALPNSLHCEWSIRALRASATKR